MSESLKEKTAKGLLWGGISNGVQQLLNLFFGVFLARLLTPDDYGMVGMLTIFSLIAGTIQESGFIPALINKKDIKHEDYNAVFWFSILTSLCLYTLLFFCAPLIARFFNQPELTSLARYSFLGFFISSTGVAHSAYFYKNLMVKQRAILNITALILSGTIGITMAYNGFSYWGIATQNIAYISTVMIGYWFYSPWRPTFQLDFTPLRKMIAFSSKMLATNIFNHLNNNIFSIILGKFYSEREVGYYNQANKWNYMGHSLISGMIHGVAQPVLTQVTNDKERQLRVFRKMMRFTAFISFPAMFGLSLIAPELITIAITDKWMGSAQILRLLCISGAFIPITGLCSNLVISKGKSNIYMWNAIALGLLQLLVMCTIYPYGIQAMIITYISINIAWLLVWYYFVQREIRYRFVHLMMDIVPFLLIAGGVMVFTYFLTLKISNIHLLFISKIIIAALLYILIMWMSGAKTFKESIQYLNNKH
ncbi:MAG: lipopolysaccharide biosynthesis protein [Bacteroides sp.]|nr:lipopolysaccharide biosynthesis protein [Bacteroides sp.]